MLLKVPLSQQKSNAERVSDDDDYIMILSFDCFTFEEFLCSKDVKFIKFLFFHSSFFKFDLNYLFEGTFLK